MRNLIMSLFGLALLSGAAAYYLSQDSRVRDLFRPIPKEASRRPSALPPARSLPPQKTAGKPAQPQAKPSAPPHQRTENPRPPEIAVNQIPNSDLSRILLQVLMAKKLSEGISLSVTDSEVAVMGEVDSEDKRRRILEIIEKGRQARHVVARNLTVATPGTKQP